MLLLQTLCNDLRLLDQVQHQITAEDFDDADLRAIYTTLLTFSLPGCTQGVSRLLEETLLSPQATQLLHQMATVEPVLSNPADVSKALHDCLTKICQQRFKAQRQRIIGQLHGTADDTAEQQQLLQEYRQTQQRTTHWFLVAGVLSVGTRESFALPRSLIAIGEQVQCGVAGGARCQCGGVVNYGEER